MRSIGVNVCPCFLFGIDVVFVGVKEEERRPAPGGMVSGMINRGLGYPCQQPKIEENQVVSDSPLDSI